MVISFPLQALISAQGKYQSQVPGFKFNLGFCGYYYNRGMEVEQLGNQRLVKNKNLFNWFGHMYNHYQPHNCSEEKLVDYMTRNKQFAVVSVGRVPSSGKVSREETLVK